MRKSPGTPRYVGTLEQAFVAAVNHGMQKGKERLARNVAKGLDDEQVGSIVLGLSENELVALDKVLKAVRADDLPPILEELRADIADGISGNTLHLRVRGQG